jgi:hypothetical protein
MPDQINISGLQKLWPFAAAVIGAVGIIWSAATEVSGN